MKKQLITGLILTVAAASAVAGVKEKKVMRAADAITTAQLAKTKVACANPNLTLDMGWDGFKTMTKVNKDALKKKRYYADRLMYDVGARTNSVLEALAKICSDDADYKEEIAAVTAIKVVPKPKVDDYRSSFSMEDSVITVTTGYYMTRDKGDYISPIKELF